MLEHTSRLQANERNARMRSQLLEAEGEASKQAAHDGNLLIMLRNAEQEIKVGEPRSSWFARHGATNKRALVPRPLRLPSGEGKDAPGPEQGVCGGQGAA